MAKKVSVADIAPAHVNGLKSSIHALEVQITLLKTMLGDTTPAAASDDEDDQDEDEDEEEETPARKPGRPAKKAKEEDEDEEEEDEDEDEEEDEDEDEEEDEDDGGDEVEAERAKVADALKAHAGKNGRAAAIAIMKKVGKVKSVQDLKPELFKKVIKALK